MFLVHPAVMIVSPNPISNCIGAKREYRDARNYQDFQIFKVLTHFFLICFNLRFLNNEPVSTIYRYVIYFKLYAKALDVDEPTA